MAEYKIYEVSIDEEDLGLTAVSFVEAPAISSNFIYMSEQKDVQLYFNKYKHEVVGALLIPNQLILRIADDGSKYYIKWSEKSIQKAMHKFLLSGVHNRVTFEHPQIENPNLTYEECELKDVYLMNMWQIADEKKDIMNTKYNYHLPKGTLCARYKVNNKKLWQAILKGEVKGFSIEAISNIKLDNTNTVKLSKSTNNKQEMKKSNNMNLFQKITHFLNEISEEVKELEAIAKTDETESGEVSLKYFTSDNDYIEVDSEGLCTASDGTVLEDGEYPLIDGNVLVVADGKFGGTKETSDEEKNVVEAPIAESKEEEDEEKKDEEVAEPTEEPTEEVVEVEPPYTLVDIEIEGVTYQVPQEVYDYIQSISAASESFRKELSNLQSRIPSTEIKQSKINQSVGKSDKYDKMVQLLNNRKL